MSFFKKTFNKVKKTAESTVKDSKKVADTKTQEVAKTAAESLPVVKEVGTDVADVVINSSDPEYWEKELPRLRERFYKLREDYYVERDAYNQTRLNYQERYSLYQSIQEGNAKLGLNLLSDRGSIADPSTDFYLNYDEVEGTLKFTLGLISLGVSDVIYARQEAQKEADHLRAQNAKLEQVIHQIRTSRKQHEDALAQLNQSLEQLLMMYGPDTTLENVLDRQNAFLSHQAEQEARAEIARNLKAAGVSAEMIRHITGLSTAQLANLGIYP